MKVNLYNQTEENIRKIKSLLKKVFKPIEESLSMQIILVTQETIHEMNKTYRQIDKPTDVLSFINDDELDNSLGDIFISIEQARLQSIEYGHSFEREIAFLAVHGYLHLKGFDHHTKEEESIMIQEQERILKRANLERNTL
ncbi:MAG: rRNA maturation RNase YbeY [Bacillota bacterium]|nr:MAG: rRNA maturation RNase YbeY [Bacillota bacterium]